MEPRAATYVWTLSAFLVFLVTSVAGEIRCYCNQAACVSTGYMCKSSVSTCFSDEGSHGCQTLDQPECGEDGRDCCWDDMCNYDVPSLDSGVIEESLVEETERISLAEDRLRREVWFRAAVIAVPVAGICVLILLVIAAARMLRQDADRRQRRLVELRRIYSQSLRGSLLTWKQDKGTSMV